MKFFTYGLSNFTIQTIQTKQLFHHLSSNTLLEFGGDPLRGRGEKLVFPKHLQFISYRKAPNRTFESYGSHLLRRKIYTSIYVPVVTANGHLPNVHLNIKPKHIYFYILNKCLVNFCKPRSCFFWFYYIKQLTNIYPFCNTKVAN